MDFTQMGPTVQMHVGIYKKEWQSPRLWPFLGQCGVSGLQKERAHGLAGLSSKGMMAAALSPFPSALTHHPHQSQGRASG